MPDNQSGWTPSHQIATQYATEGLKALVIANGGAVVAILTFAGNANTKVNPAAISNGLMAFAGGLIAVLVVFFCSYVSQWHYTSEKPSEERTGDRWRMAALVSAVLSIALFGAGCWVSWQGFKAPAQPPAPVVATMSCAEAVDFIRAQADAGMPTARNPKNRYEAVQVRGGWVVLPTCQRKP